MGLTRAKRRELGDLTLRAARELTVELGRPATVKEIAVYLDIDPADFGLFLEALSPYVDEAMAQLKRAALAGLPDAKQREIYMQTARDVLNDDDGMPRSVRAREGLHLVVLADNTWRSLLD